MAKKNKQGLYSILLYTILILYSVVTLLPFLWTVSASFKEYGEIVGGGFNLIPKKFTLDN